MHSFIYIFAIVLLCGLWGNASQTTLKPLQTIVNKALRIMTFAPFGNLDLTPMYDFLKVLNIKQIFLLECGKFQYKLHSNLLPITIGGYFLEDRSATRLVRHTRYAESSFQIKGPKLWEEIPNEIKDSQSFPIFKRAYKNFLLSTNGS